MNDPIFFEHLFKHAKQVTPYLDGQITPLLEANLAHQLIHKEIPSSDTLRELYENLKNEHPEAGAAYWLTRTWTLLCWQPIYVAFISIYSCRGLPELSSMAQQVHPNFIGGYQFPSTAYVTGSEDELVTRSGQELVSLFDYFREEMSEWTRIRPGFTNHLFADGILGCLVKLSQYAPELPEAYLLEQARLWLNACALPEKLIHSIHYHEHEKKLVLVRTSCCLVYKCQGRKLCRDCPRHPDNKR